ncbi:hypothetical protein O4H32_14310, partial [Castellaniella denitrificans]|nr:hypothetical protein [Castellaniella denitrificans]
MTQEAVQITTTPPLPGLQLVQDMNKALETIATDFAGSTDPAAMAWAYSTWADTGTGTFKRRNAANSAWAIEGRLLRAHLPMYAQVDVPALDIGPIYIIGKGPAEWVGAAYKPLISGIPGATFAEVDALVADQGPIIVTDMGCMPWVWTNTAYFTGYRNPLCATIPQHFAATARAWEMPVTGGVWSESDPKQRRLIAWFREQGLTVASGSWAKGWGRIADLGGGDWKAPDLQDVFLRMAGTDADTANAAGAGVGKLNTLKAHDHLTWSSS